MRTHVPAVAMGEAGGPSDLSELLGPGAEEAAAELRRTVEFLLGRLAGRYRLAREHRDDLVQDVLTTCLEQARKIREGDSEPLRNRDAWLVRVTHHAVLALGRRSRRRPQDDSGWPETFEPPAPAPIGAAERMTVRRALAALDEACRRLLILRDVLEEGRSEIAEQLGITSNALGVRLHRCRRKLLELYEGHVAA